MIILDKCHNELLRNHRDKLSPAFLRDLSALRAHWASRYPHLEPHLGPDPLSDHSAGADGGTGRGNDNPPSPDDESPPPSERKTVAAAWTRSPATLRKFIGQYLPRGWAGFAGAGSGSGSGKRVRQGVPGKVMMVGRRGPLRF